MNILIFQDLSHVLSVMITILGKHLFRSEMILGEAVLIGIVLLAVMIGLLKQRMILVGKKKMKTVKMKTVKILVSDTKEAGKMKLTFEYDPPIESPMIDSQAQAFGFFVETMLPEILQRFEKITSEKSEMEKPCYCPECTDKRQQQSAMSGMH